MGSDPIVIVGAGHAGVQAAASLREEGCAGGLMLVSDETTLPYQRPPSSKAFMKKAAAAPDLLLRDIADAIRLRDRLRDAREIVIVGAGFIGLEFAATAAAGGIRGYVVEAAPRVMARAVSEPLSMFFHRAARRLIATGIGLTPEHAADPDFDLRSLAGGRAVGGATA